MTSEDGAPAARILRRLAPFAGPALIVAAVVVAMGDFVFRPLISAQHEDLLSISLPMHCLMGRSLAAGTIPLWNPYAMAGVPFAADPQSGWLNLPVMALFSALPCAGAQRALIVLHPVIAGLGTFWLLREEGTGRPAATVGGLVLALGMAGASLVVYLPFAAVVAWLPVLLATVSRALRAPEWPGRLAWTGAAALAWGQLAATHLSLGIPIGTAVALAYGAVLARGEVRHGRLSVRRACALGALLLGAFVAVNLAVLVPRAGYVSRSTLGMSYEQLRALDEELSPGTSPLPQRAVGPTAQVTWPLKMATSPGLYLGAIPLLLAPAAVAYGRARRTAIALSAVTVVACVLSARPVARALTPLVAKLPFGTFYGHSPLRLALAALPAMAVLSGLGLEAWLGARSWRRRAWLLVPGAAVFGMLPPLLGAAPRSLLLFGLGAAAGGALLAAATRSPVAVLLLPVLLAAELVANVLGGLDQRGFGVAGGRTGIPAPPVFDESLRRPRVRAELYLEERETVRTMLEADAGRYLGRAPHLLTRRGFLTRQRPIDWGVLANQRGMLFGLEDVQGYNSIQLRRFWALVRSLTRRDLDYNAAAFPNISPAVLNVLRVNWVVGSEESPPEGGRPVALDGRWILYDLPGQTPLASAIGAWRVVSSDRASLSAVLAPGFDPDREVILERDPGLGRPGSGGATARVNVRARSSARLELEVTGESPSVVLVRIPYDTGWHATVDGRPADVLPGDFVIQAVPVGPGSHVVVLEFRDPLIGVGMAGTALSLAGLFGSAWFLAARERRRRRATGALDASTAPPEAPPDR